MLKSISLAKKKKKKQRVATNSGAEEDEGPITSRINYRINCRINDVPLYEGRTTRSGEGHLWSYRDELIKKRKKNRGGRRLVAEELHPNYPNISSPKKKRNKVLSQRQSPPRDSQDRQKAIFFFKKGEGADYGFFFYDKKKRRSLSWNIALTRKISIIGCWPKISPANTDEKRTTWLANSNQ